MFFGYDHLSDIPGAIEAFNVLAWCASGVVWVGGFIAHALGIPIV